MKKDLYPEDEIKKWSDEERPVLIEKYGESSRIAPALINALRKGDTEAFEKLYTHMGGTIEDFLTSILHSREDAREITQDIFADLWENRSEIKSAKNFKGFLFVTAKNRALNFLKKRKTQLKYYDMELPGGESPDYSVEDIIAARETEILIRITLDTMPEKHRKVFEMRHYDGKTDDEIAKALGLTKASVQVYFSNVLKELSRVVMLFTILFLSP